MNIEIERMAMMVTNINTKTETHGGEIVLATDVDLAANMPIEVLGKFSEDDQDWPKTWRALLWNKKGEITGHCLSHIEFHHEYKDHIVLIVDEEENVMRFEKSRVSKFQAEPLPGHRIELKFQVRVYPDKRQNGELSALQKRLTQAEVMGSVQGDLLQVVK